MEVEEREILLEKSSVLRQELKVWERNFAVLNGGRKAGRDDIKQNPTIAQKYKDYNRNRDILSGKTLSQYPSSPSQKTSRKRKHEPTRVPSPSKRLQITKTPSKPTLHPAMTDPYDSPSLVRTLFTPSRNRVVGPTPQKDGQVLGLFDLISEHDESPISKGRPAVSGTDELPLVTPRKLNGYGETAPGSIRPSRTPVSSGKRFVLDGFATPLKRRHPNELGGRTPSSVSKLHFTTPSFLRRDSQRAPMAPIQETSGNLIISPQMIRPLRKPLVRGLSSMLASLRKMEEEAADDDLDAMREMESENQCPMKPTNKEIVQVADSQPHVLLGGLDDEAMYDSEPEEVKNPPLGRDGRPVPVWKKKGQKRTTRHVTIKPVRQRLQPNPHSASQVTQSLSPLPSPTNDLDDNLQIKEATDVFSAEVGNFDSDSASEYTASEGGTRYRRPNQEKRKKRRETGEADDEGEGRARKSMRKVGSIAHANFKRLKLRNSGAKGATGYGNRFRRKR